MPEALLELRNVTAGYGSIRVLKGISLTLGQQDRVGLFGPNGHGKSTLLDGISGLLRPIGGEILLKGEPIQDWSPLRILDAGLVHVCQGNTLFPRMSVMENLFCGAFRRKVWKERKDRIGRIFDLFPRLSERRKQKAGTLSGGERQMLAIGAGLMAGGELLMLDEPTLGLAPVVRLELADAISKAARDGIAIVLVEQDFDFLSELVDRFYMIEEGRVVFEGRPADLSENRIAEMYFGGAKNTVQCADGAGQSVTPDKGGD